MEHMAQAEYCLSIDQVGLLSRANLFASWGMVECVTTARNMSQRVLLTDSTGSTHARLRTLLVPKTVCSEEPIIQNSQTRLCTAA
jgi:hypothetical protein